MRRGPCWPAAAALLLGSLAACGKGAAPGAPPAMPVEVVTLVQRPVEQTTEYVGTVKSRRSTTVQPQVEGFITRIMVSSGDHVRPGTPLMTIDAGMQQAAVANLESVRAARQADLRYAQQQAARMKTLLEAGAASKAERSRPRRRWPPAGPSSRRWRRRSASSACPSPTTR